MSRWKPIRTHLRSLLFFKIYQLFFSLPFDFCLVLFHWCHQERAVNIIIHSVWFRYMTGKWRISYSNSFSLEFNTNNWDHHTHIIRLDKSVVLPFITLKFLFQDNRVTRYQNLLKCIFSIQPIHLLASSPAYLIFFFLQF